MKRLALLFAGGAIWLLLAAAPVFADGGPHISVVNNGSAGINADSCAGCHRAHTAQGQYLIKSATEEALCLTCHGAVSVGATTDVMTGVQYAVRDVSGVGGTKLGALRNGGFVQARIDTSNAVREAYPRNAALDISMRTQVGSLAAPVAVTSAHLDLDGAGGVASNGIAWGNGANGSGAGPAVPALSCVACHNPHGNGQYRILRPIPNTTAGGFTGYRSINVASNDASTITTAIAHDLQPGDLVTLTGVGGLTGNYAVRTSTTNTFTVSAIPYGGAAIGLTAGTGGTMQKTSTPVQDSPIGTPVAGVYPTKNYTVVQAKGTPGTDSTYLLYASQVPAGAAGDYFHRNVPWTPSVNNPVTCAPTAFVDTTAFPQCATAFDAPNGRPTADLTSGRIAFNTQMTAWCSACHTRYYANGNPNPTGTDLGPTGLPAATAQSWWFPRPGTTGAGSTDSIYKYQHSTNQNKVCTTCHVSHGSNAQMTGPFSASFTQPDGTQSATVGDSRLLKIDNRGTCQACHDPTNTTAAGAYVGTSPKPAVP